MCPREKSAARSWLTIHWFDQEVNVRNIPTDDDWEVSNDGAAADDADSSNKVQ